MWEPWGLLWVGLSCLCTGHFQPPPSPCQGWEHCARCAGSQAGRAKTPCPGLRSLLLIARCERAPSVPAAPCAGAPPSRSLRCCCEKALCWGRESCSIVAGLHGHTFQRADLNLVSYRSGGAVPECIISMGKQAPNSLICKTDQARSAEGTGKSWEKREVAKPWQNSLPGAHGTGEQGGLNHQKKALWDRLHLACCWPSKATACCSCSADPG